MLWEVLMRVERIACDQDADNAQVLRAAHCLATISGSYTKVLEVHDLEQRILRLEQLGGAS